MNRITPTSSADFNQVAYFIITNEIVLTGDLALKSGSILDFRGGCFSGSHKLNLKGCPIRAPHIGIFDEGLKVSGMGGNPAVYAEWFNLGDSNKTSGDEDFINRALEAAQGIPVILESKTYYLKNPIYLGPYVEEVEDKDKEEIISIEHNISSQIGTFTLICPGTLKLNSDTSAIALGYKNLRIQVNQIEGPDLTESEKQAISPALYQGSGLRFYDNVYNADIDVACMTNIHKGINVVLNHLHDANSDGTYDVEHKTDIGLQYLKLNFCNIDADYCIYGNLKKTPNFKKWFNECQFNGGRLVGRYGIFLLCDTTAFNGNVFRTIELGDLTEAAIQTDVSEFCYYRNLSVTSQIPTGSDKKLVKVTQARATQLSFLNYLAPNRVEFNGRCDSTVISAPIYAPQLGLDVPNQFDTITVRSVIYKSANQAEPDKIDIYPLLTSSVHPFNMAKTVTRIPDKELLILSDLFPKVECENSSVALSVDFDVLPSMVFFKVDSLETLKVDLGGLKDVSPAFTEFYAQIATGGRLLLTGGNQRVPLQFVTYASGGLTYSASLAIIKTGLYKMVWQGQDKLLVYKES